MNRILVLSLALASTTAAGALLACSDPIEVVALTPAQAVERFARQEGTPDVQSAGIVVSHADVALARVVYGQPRCENGVCGHPIAWALRRGERIGWVDPPPVAAPTFYDPTAEEEGVFSEAFLERVRLQANEAYAPLLLLLAADADTPRFTLLHIADRLGGEARRTSIAEALLDHPVGATDREILGLVIDAAFFETAWRDVRERAWAQLAAIQPDLDVLEATAAASRPAAGVLRIELTLTNPSDRPIRLEHAGRCAPSILLFDRPDLSGDPVWSGPVPCKGFPATVDLAAGGTVTIATEVEDEEILADGLAPGAYHLAFWLRFVQPEPAELVVAAGSMELGS